MSESSKKHPLPKPPFLYAILDRSLVSKIDVGPAARSLVAGGAEIIQYRAKNIRRRERIEDIKRIVDASRQRCVPVIVNDDPSLVLETGAHGVHLGRDDPSPGRARDMMGHDLIVGLTVHSFEELHEAELGLVDYIAVGAVFPSATKPSSGILPAGFIARAREIAGLPIVAIGGINAGNVKEVLDEGADGIAAVSSLLKGDIEKNCFTLRGIIDRRKC